MRLSRRILSVIAFVVALAAGCKAWVAACSLPQDLQLSVQYVSVLKQQLQDPARVAVILYDEATRQLSRFGKSGLYEFYLYELCQGDDCFIESVSILLEVESWPVCWTDNHFNHYIATITFDDFTTFEAELETERIRASWGSNQPSYSKFRAELKRERNVALHRIRNSDRHSEEVVRIKYNRYFGTWFPADEWYTSWSVAD